MSVDPDIGDKPAADFFEVTIVKRWHAWLVAAASFLPILLFAAITQDHGGEDLALLHPCRVVIRRSRDQRQLTQFRYLRLGPAAEHRVLISQLIDSQTVETFCAQYDIDVSDAA